jgi:hypothetical protein
MVQWPFVPELSSTLSTQLSSRASYGEVRNGVTHFRLQGQAVGDHMTFVRGESPPLYSFAIIGRVQSCCVCASRCLMALFYVAILTRRRKRNDLDVTDDGKDSSGRGQQVFGDGMQAGPDRSRFRCRRGQRWGRSFTAGSGG